jgi:hypothetical protein
MMVKRLLAIGGIALTVGFGLTGAAIADASAHDHNRVAEAAALPPDCSSGGLVDKKVEGSPVGVYGGAWITCGRGPSQLSAVSAEVTLYRDGLAVAYDKGVCNLPPGGGGCSAGTPITPNPAGAQTWCAAARTETAWGATWSHSYCASY